MKKNQNWQSYSTFVDTMSSLYSIWVATFNKCSNALFFLACSKLVTMAIYVRKLDKVSTRIWSEIWHFVGPRRWYWGKKWFWIARGTKNISESHHNTISVRNRDHTRSLSKKSNLESTNGNGTTKTTAVVVTVVNP